MKDEQKDYEKELIERASLLFEHQKEQYEIAIDGYRRLEDKLQKLFGATSIIITTTVLIVRYWYRDLFPGVYEPFHAFCWLFLILFTVFVLIAWGFTFSGMQTRVLERPNSSNKLTDLFMLNPRKDVLSSFAHEYSRLTDVIDVLHAEKVKIMNNCSQAMLFAAWAFVAFLISFIAIKIQFEGDGWLKNQNTKQVEIEMQQDKVISKLLADLTTQIKPTSTQD
jgi:hypothetical protein